METSTEREGLLSRRGAGDVFSERVCTLVLFIRISEVCLVDNSVYMHNMCITEPSLVESHTRNDLV